jgi:hydrogenase expression/formation protein HypC
MQIIRCDIGKALCTDGFEQKWIDMSLIGDQSEGTWVLVFLDVAREVLQPERAEQIKKAIGAVAAVMKGDSDDFDDLFADLVEREPQLPEHLQTK